MPPAALGESDLFPAAILLLVWWHPKDMEHTLRSLMIVSFLSGCATSSESGQPDLDQHLWQDRVVLLFADDLNDPDMNTTRSALIGNLSGVHERDIVIYVLKSTSPTGRRFDATGQGFTFVLLGKDGGEKLRSTSVVTLQTLYETIDSMPMRQVEMRERDE